MIAKFVITKVDTGLFYTGKEEDKSTTYTAYINKVPKEVVFKTYQEAEDKVSKLSTGFYQIEKIFKV